METKEQCVKNVQSYSRTASMTSFWRRSDFTDCSKVATLDFTLMPAGLVHENIIFSKLQKPTFSSRQHEF